MLHNTQGPESVLHITCLRELSAAAAHPVHTSVPVQVLPVQTMSIESLACTIHLYNMSACGHGALQSGDLNAVYSVGRTS